ncbi:MAG: nucleotidyltransferase domain-containing protein [Myxococcota bacterium]
MIFLDPPHVGEDSLRARIPSLSSHDPPPVFVSLWSGPSVHGFRASPERIGGVVVQPAHVVLGLRGWEDAFEGVLDHGTPYVLFDLEKIIRMALRQSTLAMELLSAPIVHHAAPEFSPRDIVAGLITRQLVRAYDQMTRDVGEIIARRDASGALCRVREMLTGATLARDGVFSLHIDDLVQNWASDELSVMVQAMRRGVALEEDQWSALERELKDVRARLSLEAVEALPEQPTSYDAVHDALVAMRLIAGH